LYSFVSSPYWEQSARQASEEQNDELKSSHTFEGKRTFVTKLLWKYVKVYIVHKQTKLNSVVLVRPQTIPTERPPPGGEVSANF